ncbi:hypothetical protein [Steroidobacter sp.]|uniref:hypothetical protein n=1 Tax=Steroidobacter sp. TaxID=1978227 RepID=UPI001A5EE02A|nr:hypothetical protein [Steroidobacter sp.]MBL8269493.1 hypothetical protein [Steroidobacter sp.]
MKTIARLLAFGWMLAAAGTASAGGWTAVGTIDQIHFSEGKDGILIKHQLMVNPDTCGRTDYFILKLSGNLLFKEMYSTLLAAQLAGKPLNLYVSQCNSPDGFPIIVNIISAP